VHHLKHDLHEIISVTPRTILPNRSVYAIAAPWRYNWVAKEDSFVAGATAFPNFRRGLPPGVTVFANARISK
jgi:hypothetical protein